jgi:hypothetical protein
MPNRWTQPGFQGYVVQLLAQKTGSHGGCEKHKRRCSRCLCFSQPLIITATPTHTVRRRKNTKNRPNIPITPTRATIARSSMMMIYLRLNARIVSISILTTCISIKKKNSIFFVTISIINK